VKNLNLSSVLKRCGQAALLTFAALLFVGAGDSGARFNELGHRMMCVCGCNQILLECNHVGCSYSDRMRSELLASLDRGDSDDLTLQSFVQKYGTTVIAAPTTKGFNRVAWIMPFVALALGMMTVVLVVRAWRGRPTPALADGIKPVRGIELERFREQAQKETDL
jgi:cytochrome c-type biogenesis protein CcmH/NrfF